ncbi:hypothetical protein [Aliihoeflea sp. 2WW]|uniref:hypothetical protein n=1 Tax=Aliihoeflea sp. 2WW TaxID=1381123 RepID=UPI0004AF4243|nr:hypothetical protein [Aliihoeflea sp. 2WW]
MRDIQAWYRGVMYEMVDLAEQGELNEVADRWESTNVVRLNDYRMRPRMSA